MSWESDERDSALAKLEKIREMCEWVARRQLPAHRYTIREIKAVIDEPTKYN